jgi:hypothetical protein
MRFQIGGFKGGIALLRPDHNPGFLMLYGHTACFKPHNWAFPFPSADVAKKAE